MAISFATLSILLISQYYYNSERYRRDYSGMACLFIFWFFGLQILRIISQQHFPDIPNYLDVYKNVTPVWEIGESPIFKGSDNIEYGIIILMSLCKGCFDNYNFFLFIVSILELCALNFFCKRYDVKFINALLITVCMSYAFQIGILRQALAMCILYIALCYIKKIHIYICLIALGVLFHKSLIICLLIPIFSFIKNYKIWGFLFITSVIIYLLQINILPNFLNHVGEYFARVDFYINTTDIENKYISIGFWDRLIQGIMLIYIYHKLKSKDLINSKYHIIFIIGMLGLIMQMIFFEIPVITSRLRYYFFLFPIFFIAEFIYKHASKTNSVLYKLIFMSYMILQMYIQVNYMVLK